MFSGEYMFFFEQDHCMLWVVSDMQNQEFLEAGGLV